MEINPTYNIEEDVISMLTLKVKQLESKVGYHSGKLEYLSDKIEYLEKQMNLPKVEEIDEPIIATLKTIYRLESYNAGGKDIYVHCVELNEYTNKLFWHMQKKTMDQISIGTKILFKLDGDRIKDAKIINEQIN